MHMTAKFYTNFLIITLLSFFYGKAMASTISSQNKTCSSLFTSENLRERKFDFATRDDQFNFGRLYSSKDQALLKKYQHLSELFSVREYLNWKRADARLMAIPIGQFKITKSLIEEIHDLLSPSEFSETKNNYLIEQLKLPPALAAQFSKFFHHTFESRFSVQTIFKPMGEENFLDMKNNPWIDQIIEMPWPLSRSSSRRALFIYSSSNQRVQHKLDQLIRWYDEHKDKLEPVELAALFQRRLVSIHPFVDGNGRLSRLFMDRILREFDKELPLLKDFDVDLFSNEQGWVQTIRDALELTSTLKNEHGLRLDKSSAVVNGPNSVKLPFKGKISEVFNKTFIAGNQLFYLGEDAVIYSSKNIPYLKNGNKLYPITEATYFLLGSTEVREKKKWLRQFHSLILREHVRFFRNIEDGAELSNLEIIPYNEINEKNNRGEMHFYSFMRPLIEEVVENLEKSPDPLKSSSIVRTRYDLKSSQGYPKSKEGEISNRISQYQKVIWELLEISKSAKEIAPDLTEKIDQQMLRIHQHGVSYFSKIRKDIDNFDQSRLHPQIEVLKIFIDLMQLNNPNPSKDIFKQKVLARVDFPLKVKDQGFSSNKSMVEWLRTSQIFDHFITQFQDFYFSKWLPLIKQFQTDQVLVAQLHPDSPIPARYSFKDSPFAKAIGMTEFFFRALMTQITANNFRYRDDSTEFDRMYFYGLMHAQDYYTKSMVSATASPYYLIPNNFDAKTLKFAFLSSFKMYIFTTDHSNLYFNAGSDWYNTYEFLIRDGHKIQMQKSFNTSEILDQKKIQPEQLQWLQENKNIDF